MMILGYTVFFCNLNKVGVYVGIVFIIAYESNFLNIRKGVDSLLDPILNYFKIETSIWIYKCRKKPELYSNRFFDVLSLTSMFGSRFKYFNSIYFQREYRLVAYKGEDFVVINKDMMWLKKKFKNYSEVTEMSEKELKDIAKAKVKTKKELMIHLL